MQLRTDAARSTERGFTLIEIMVVVVLIGLLATLVGPRVWALLFEGQRKIAETKAQEYYDSVKLYETVTRRKPTNLTDLEQPLSPGEEPFQRIVPDPWGGEYQLERDEGRYRVLSPGRDGEFGTDDDITYPPRE